MNIKAYNKLKSLKTILKEQYGIEEFALFGSQARDDYTDHSSNFSNGKELKYSYIDWDVIIREFEIIGKLK